MKLVDEYHIVATGVEQGIKQIFQRLQMYTVVLKCEYVLWQKLAAVRKAV